MTWLPLALTLSLLAGAPRHLQSLRSAEMRSLQTIIAKDQPSLNILFQPGCGACRQQMKDVRCLEKSLQINLLGTYGNRESLSKELRRAKVAYPAFKIEPQDIAEVGFNLGITPQLLFANGKRRVVIGGYVPCPQLKKKLGL